MKCNRTFEIDRASVNEDNRTFEASLSSETVGKQFFPGIGIVKERLLHGPDNIDLSRAGRGLSFLFNHDDNRVIGGVSNIRLDDKRLRGSVSFDDDEESSTFFRKVQRGSLKDISVSYEVIDFEETKRGEVDVTKWMPVEASLVPIPMDGNVGIGRSMETKMTDETEVSEGTVESPQAEDVSLGNLASIRDRNKKAGVDAGIKAERKRVSGLREAFNPYLTRGEAYQDLYDVCMDKGYSVERGMKELLDLVGTHGTNEPVKPIQTANRGAIANGETEGEKLREGIGYALARRTGLLTKEEKEKGLGVNEFGGLTLGEIANICAQQRGWNTRGMSKAELVGKLMMNRFIDPGTANQDTTDFPGVLEDLLNKGVARGWVQARETWDQWCQTGTAQDFKTISQVKLSNVPQLPLVAENAAIAALDLSDEAEQGNLATYAGQVSLTRQAIVNDDLSMFSSIAQNMGAAAARRAGDLAYGVLTTNGNMSDGNPLFDALHSNIGTVGAIDETTINEANVLMGTQTDTAGVTLNFRVVNMVVPLALELAARKQANNSLIVDPTGSAAESNILQGQFGVIADPRLDAASPTTYYFVSDVDTVKVFFLSGNEGPQVETDEGWSTLASFWRVYIDLAAFAIDWRPMVRNATA